MKRGIKNNHGHDYDEIPVHNLSDNESEIEYTTLRDNREADTKIETADSNGMEVFEVQKDPVGASKDDPKYLKAWNYMKKKASQLQNRIFEATPEPVRPYFPYMLDPVIYLTLYYISYRNWESSLVGCVGDLMVCFKNMVRRIE